MKKLVLSALLLGSVSFVSKAQLADGSIAPDFTVTAYQPWLSSQGMNSNGTYKLYDYLDAGYTVILDVSATWCGPCWTYHLTGAMDNVFINHGPAGHYGVSASTTDDVMVIWIEGDSQTGDATMLDGAGSIGNWIEPNATLGQIPFPMANPASAATINSGYNIGYFPTLYRICPNRTTKLLSTSTANATGTYLYNQATQCPAPASAPADVAMMSFDGETEICPGDYTPVVKIQNNGTTNLTNATVTVTQGGNTVSTGVYTGNLATYGIATVTCSTISGFNGGALVATVTTVGDANAANGTRNKTVTVNNNPAMAVSNNIYVSVTTDRYASETSWDVKNAAGTVIASGGPWSNLSANGTTVRPTVTVSNLIPNECYKFTINDSYGDGLCCDYGAGSYSVTDAAGNTLLSGGSFTFTDGGLIRSGVANLDELHIKEFNVYPNPASEVLNVAFETSENAVITMLDLQGRVVATQLANGQTGTQIVEFAVNELAKGSYIVKIASNGFTKTQNVVVK
jgi:hypothetical protein